MTEHRLAEALARLDALVNWERRDRDAAMRRGIDPVADVLERLGGPTARFRAVHVAGTKGKGTTSSLVAAVLAKAGKRVGLYTSPHVDRICERIRVDGLDVGDSTLARALELALEARSSAVAEGTPGAAATWFDLVTAAGFLVFAEAEVEWAVVECGLGGRLDSTNVVRGEVCIVTNIDLEHTAVLGNSLAAIAREKGGILKRGSTLVTGVLPDPRLSPAEDPAHVLDGIARELRCHVLRPPALAPTMLERNIDLARLALDELGAREVRDGDGWPVGAGLLDPETIQAARLPGRLEKRLHGDVRVVIDAAHVPSSVRMVLQELAGDPDLPGRPVVVVALGRDKNAREIFKILAETTDRVVCTTVPSGPLLAAEALVEEARCVGLGAETAADPRTAYARALEIAEDGRWVLVIGSFYLAGAIRRELVAKLPQPPA
ncbi:MAG: bifunctional folylpolyglutamate synthase/dihydrofolate synthase [Planctomycetota bacterium]